MGRVCVVGIEKNTRIKKTFLKDQFIRKTIHTHTCTNIYIYLIEFKKKLEAKTNRTKK